MKSKIIGIIVAAAFVPLINQNANAANFYAGGLFGLGSTFTFSGFNNDAIKNWSRSSESFGAIAGIDVSVVRLELEYEYMNSKGPKSNLNFANLYLKIPIGIIQPYIAAGIGITYGGHATYETSPHSFETSTKTRPAYQGMLGLSVKIPVLKFLHSDLEFRMAYMPNLYEYDKINVDVWNGDFRLKVCYDF